ncbi:hypothetical protein CE91St54_66580 [Hungatella hathewayi]|uniref:Uncharacterized protein n=1 Tax=Hungatella hathewayi TaxID=154046 RepID=A0AA37JJ17_9FIRM|nr:hypothetical protein CE91St55_40550 [Hungatella hathewayi]GKH11550.1 hypothetical protein CE91St54_66580 [Hungatella hathewayi]
MHWILRIRQVCSRKLYINASDNGGTAGASNGNGPEMPPERNNEGGI